MSRRRLRGGGVAALALAAAFLLSPRARPADRRVLLVELDGPIGPVAAEFLEHAVQSASDEGAACLIVRIDTPGGLDLAMRSIVKAFEESPIPIVCYVAPSGARAASAGVALMLSSHLAAMAPGTNVGAAHPVNLGGGSMGKEMTQKVENDAAAYMRSLAAKHDRNVDWAEKAVRESISSSADEALKEGVIDLIAPSLDDLLARIDGRKVQVAGREVALETKGARVDREEMGLRFRILAALSDPNIAYILLMIGVWGLFFELSNPGAIFPGVIGGICLILGFVALQTLPYNVAGVALILLAFLFFLAEVWVTSHGLLAIGGTIALLLGSIMLFKGGGPAYQVSMKLIFATVGTTVAFFAVVLLLVVRAHRAKPITGPEGLLNLVGETRTKLDPAGQVFVHGEIWSARSEEPLRPGQRVRVVGVEGLTLTVRKD